MHVVCIRMLLSAPICLSTLQKHEGGFVLILKSAWGVLSTLYYWAWGVLSALKKTCGGFCPHIPKWTWGVLSVGCFVLHSTTPSTVCKHVAAVVLKSKYATYKNNVVGCSSTVLTAMCVDI